MTFHFTDEVREALAAARNEAHERGHGYVGTEHILLGLLRDAVVVAVLRAAGADAGSVRGALEQAVRQGNRGTPLGELPYTSGGKKALEYAIAEARTEGNAVTQLHLLLGLLREEKGIAAVVLCSLGATLERTRAIIRRGPPYAAEESGFRIVIDDTADVSIYEQIVARVQEAVATGVLRRGERLPAVRRLADELEIAPGTVARAYGELERLGVVVTDGARGTRVADPTPEPRQGGADLDALVGLIRPVVVAAFHMGATAADLRAALDAAMQGIFSEGEPRP